MERKTYSVGLILWEHTETEEGSVLDDDPREEECSVIVDDWREAGALYDRILKAFPELSNRTGGLPCLKED